MKYLFKMRESPSTIAKTFGLSARKIGRQRRKRANAIEGRLDRRAPCSRLAGDDHHGKGGYKKQGTKREPI